MAFQRNITGILLLFCVFTLVIASASADPGPPPPDQNLVLRAYEGILAAIGLAHPGPAAHAQEPVPVATTPPPVTTTEAPASVEMAYLENVDCSVMDEKVTTYRCKGNVRIPGGIYDEVQVIAKYADNNTFASAAVPMGGSNFTLKAFMLFPDLKYLNEEPAFTVRLDTGKFPVVMDGSHGIAYINPPPAPAIVRVRVTPEKITDNTGVPGPVTTAPGDPASGPVIRTFPYVLQGTRGNIPVTLHAGVYNSQKALPKVYTCIRYNHDPTPCTPAETRQYYLTFLDEPSQEADLDALVRQIRQAAPDPDDQVRIAISLVQQIPYDHAAAGLPGTGSQRYPSQTLYDNRGVCSDKSLLLAYLLRELGYGTALLSFEDEQHMAVGITAPAPYTYKSTGYAFVETTIPSIPTDAAGEYAGGQRLTSTPEVIRIGDGLPFAGIAEEYADALLFASFGGNASLPPAQYRQWETLMWKYGMRTATGKTFEDNPAGRPLCENGIACNGACYTQCPGPSWACTPKGLVCYY